MKKRRFDNYNGTFPQLGLGSWLGENAGAVGKVVGAGVGMALAPVTGGASIALGTQLGGMAGNAIQGGVDAKAQQAQALRQQRLMNAQNMQIQAQQSYMPIMKMGGSLYPNGGNLINYNGQTHEGADGGVAVDAQGNPTAQSGQSPIALVEGGEVGWKTSDGRVFVFSDRLGFAKEAKRIMSRNKGREDDPISKKGMDMELSRLADKQEVLKQMMEQENEQEEQNEENMTTYKNGGKLPKYPEGGTVGGSYDYRSDHMKLQQAWLDKLTPEQRAEFQSVMGMKIDDPNRQQRATAFMTKAGNDVYLTEDEQANVLGDKARYTQYRNYINTTFPKAGASTQGTYANSANLWGGRHAFDYGNVPATPTPQPAVSAYKARTYDPFKGVEVASDKGVAFTFKDQQAQAAAEKAGTYTSGNRNFIYNKGSWYDAPITTTPAVSIADTAKTLPLVPLKMCGGKMAMGGGLPKYEDGDFLKAKSVGVMPVDMSMPTTAPSAISGVASSATGATPQQFTGNYNYMIPAAQAVGDVAMLALTNKFKPQGISVADIKPREVSYAPQRSAMQSSAMAQQRANQMAMRNAGINPQQYMGAVGAANVDAQRAANEGIMSSAMAEQQANVGTANQFAGINAQRRMQAGMYNNQLANMYNQQKLGIYKDLASLPVNTMRDVQDIRNYETQQQRLQPYYDYNVAPNATGMQKFMGKTPVQKSVSKYGSGLSLNKKGGYLKK